MDEAKPPLRAANAASRLVRLEAAAHRSSKLIQSSPSRSSLARRPSRRATETTHERVLAREVAASSSSHPRFTARARRPRQAVACAARARRRACSTWPAGAVHVHRALRFARSSRAAPVMAPAGAFGLGRLGVALSRRGTKSGTGPRYPVEFAETCGYSPRLSTPKWPAGLGGRSALRPTFPTRSVRQTTLHCLAPPTSWVLHTAGWGASAPGVEPFRGRAVRSGGVHRCFIPFTATMLLRHRGRNRKNPASDPSEPRQAAFLADFIARPGAIPACLLNADGASARRSARYFPEGVKAPSATTEMPHKKHATRLRQSLVRQTARALGSHHRFFNHVATWYLPGGAEKKTWPPPPVVERISAGRACDRAAFPLLPSRFPTSGTRGPRPLPVHRGMVPRPRTRAAWSSNRDEVRHRMQSAIDEMRARRKGIFFGSIFEPGSMAGRTDRAERPHGSA